MKNNIPEEVSSSRTAEMGTNQSWEPVGHLTECKYAAHWINHEERT